MKPQAMLEQLEKVAQKASVKVSYEALPVNIGHGGLCRVKHQYRVIIDKRATVHDRISTLAQALGELDIHTEELSPKVRQLIEHYRRRRQTRRAAS